MDIDDLILQVLEERQQCSIPELVRGVQDRQPSLYEFAIKAALLGQIRRNRVDLDKDFNLRCVKVEGSDN